MIYSDILSDVNVRLNNKKGIYNKILMKPKMINTITLLWVPTHICIQGNKEGDAAAKQSLNVSLAYEAPCFHKVITNILIHNII